MPPVVDVVATRGHVEERLARALGSGRGAALAPGTLGWEDFVAALRAAAAPALRVAPAEVEGLALAAAVRSVLPAYEPAYTERQGTVDAFARTLQILRRHGVVPAVLEAARGAAGDEEDGVRARLGVLAAVQQEHDARLARGGWVAAAEVESRVATALATAPGPEALGLGADLRLWHLAELPPTRVALLVALGRVLAAGGGRCLAHVVCEPRRTKLPVGMDRALRVLEADEGVALELVHGLRDPSLPEPCGALAEWVVAMAVGGRAAGVPLALAEAHGPDEEARWVASRVERWREDGIADHEIAVVVRQGDDRVSGALTRALDDARIPWRSGRSGRLVASPVARALLSLPRIVARGAPREEVLRALAVLQGNGPGRAAPEPWRVGNALRAAAVESFFDTELGERLAGGRWGAGAAVTVAAEDLARELWALAQDGTVEEHSARLARWLLRSGRDGRYLEESRTVMASAGFDPGSQAILRALARDEAALAGVGELLRDLPAAARAAGTEGRISAGVFGEMLADLGRVWELPGESAHAGGVMLLEAREAVGRGVRALAVMGLWDGGFPPRREEEALWGDGERMAVGRALRAPVERGGTREAESLLLLSVLAAAGESVAASFARHDAAGRTRSASPFFADMQRAAGAEVERVGRDPLARSRRVPARGVERGLRALAAVGDGAQPGLAVAGGAVGAALGSVRRRAAVERARSEYFARAGAEGGPYTGRITGAAALVRALGLRDYAGPKRPVDVTTLERAARCGFKAFALEVLRLDERRDVFETMDEAQRGHLLHKLLEAGQEALREHAGVGVAAAREAVRAALDEAGAEFALKEPTRNPSLLDADLRSIRRQVEAWLDRRLGEEEPWEMVETEVAFGPRKKWPALEVPVAGESPIVIKGRIDGVERVGDVLRVVEFKSGRGEGFRRRLLEGVLDTQFQLVVYAAALERARRAGAVAAQAQVDGLYVGFRDLSEHGLREMFSRPRRRGPAVDVDALVAQGALGEGPLGDAVRAAVLPLREGDFRPRPRDCDLCPYRAVCRVEAHEGVVDEAVEGEGRT